MASMRTVRTTFNGGEITPGLFGNVEQAKVQSGLALCRNFVALPHGPVQNRAGLAFVNAVKNSANKTRLLPFSFSATETFAIELGAGYFRFHSAGETVMAVGSPQLVSNNSFGSNISGWTNASGAGSSLAWDSGAGGRLKLVSAGGTLAEAYQAITTVPGQRYMIGSAGSKGTGSTWGAQLLVGSTPGGSDLLNMSAILGITPFAGSPWGSFVASGTTTYVTFQGSNSGATDYVACVVCAAWSGYVIPWADVTGYGVGVLASDAVGNVFYCVANAPAGAVLTNTSYWYALSGPYEIPNPYAVADLFDVHYVQSGDVLTLTHPGYAPLELRRYGNLNWQLAAPSFGSSLGVPTSVGSQTVGTSTNAYPQNYAYLVTAVDAYGLQESLPSAAVSVSWDLTLAGNSVTISWGAPVGNYATAPSFYNVYKAIGGGAFGYIGQVSAGGALQLTDKNITPDWTKTPPLNDSPFASAGNYPSAVGYYEQRRVFAGSTQQPQNVWATQPGTESNMNYSLPSRDSDALRIRIAALRANAIAHVVALWDLLLLTASTVWRVYSANGDALTPSTLTIKAQSQVGASNTQPVVVNQAAVYAASQGGHVRELSYQWQLQGYQDRDLCLLARHLFDGLTVQELAFSRSLYPLLWAVSSNGVLLGLTYLPDQEVLAWHQHTTQGLFESACVVQEGNFDVLYVVVNRTINGVQSRFVERMDTRQFGNHLAAAFFVDCGASYQAAPGTTVTTVSGLTWLAGAMVSVLADGRPLTGLTVSSGGVLTLPFAANTLQVGLAIDAQFQTPPLAIANDGSLGQGRVKNVNKVWARVLEFVGCSVGPDDGHLVSCPPQALASDGVTPVLWSGEWRLNILPSFGPDGVVVVAQPNPLPITVCDLSLEVSIGG